MCMLYRNVGKKTVVLLDLMEYITLCLVSSNEVETVVRRAQLIQYNKLAVPDVPLFLLH